MNFISANKLTNFSVVGSDQEIGQVSGIYFGNKSWKVKFLKVSSGFWIFGQRLVLPVEEISSVQAHNDLITTRFTKEQLTDLSSRISHAISGKRTRNKSAFRLWIGASTFGLPQVSPFTITNPKRRKRPSDKNPEISKLKKISFRTLKQIENYIVSAQDGKLGKVDDLILDTETWEIRYIKVDAKQKQLMLPPQWVDQLHPIDKVLSTKLEKDLVLSGPYAIGQPAN